MADNFPAAITIGGNIPRDLLDELAAVIEEEGLGDEWGEPSLSVEEIKEVFGAAAAKGETARFVDAEARYGQFDDLERHCTLNGIDFDRHNDARYEYDAENVYGRGRRRPVVISANQDGDDMVKIEEICRVLAGHAQPAWKLARIAKLTEVPPALDPIVLVDSKQRQSRNKR